MRMVPVIALLGSLSVTSVSLTARQDHHAAPARSGAAVMGFAQELTTHHFLLFTDGGAIEVEVTKASDVENRDAIRSHLPHIAMMFGAGNFEAPMLVHDSQHVPGTAVMTARKDSIRYDYVETPAGGRVNIVTSDAAALAAVHAFLTFQIAEHETGDPTTVRRR